MPFHVGGHKPGQSKTSSVTIWALLAGRLALTAAGLLMIFFGYSLIERGLHFGVDRFGGLADPRGMVLTGVLIALLAWTPERMWKALAKSKRRAP